MSFVYVWEYRVAPQHVDEFRRVYGADGDWVELFRRGEGYLGTELYRDADDPVRFVTVDHWESRSARDAFRERFRAEFDALDARCELFTLEERRIGDFVDG